MVLTMLELLANWKIVTSLICAILIYIHFKISKFNDYFKERGIPYIPGKFVFGSDINVTLVKTAIGVSVDKMYWKRKDDKLFGMFIGPKPFLVVKDPEYVNKILTPDFEYFHDRGFTINEKRFPLDAHLFFLNGNKWKIIRTLLTPVFTPNKLKYMFPEMSKCSNILIDYIDKMATGYDVDLKNILQRFGMDVIATTAFGLEPESVKNPENEFHKMGKKLFVPNIKQSFKIFLMFATRKLFTNLKFSIFQAEGHEFFLRIFKEVFEFRRKSGIERNDFLQLLLEIKDKRTLKIEDDNYNIKEKIDITDEILAAQSFVFLLAGFETTSDCLNYTIFFLSKNKEAQEKARREIQLILKKFNGEYSYDSLKEMTYLENCIAESARLIPPVPILNRVVEKDYTFPDGTVVEKGLDVIIPIYSIQRDPRHYKDPEVYNPDRFNEQPEKGLYQPFGDGPRHCIGKRFAYLEMKMVLAKLLNSYHLEESKLTKDPFEFRPVIQLSTSHPLYIRLVKINT